MSGGRPWWFPTAVFVAPLGIAMIVTATLVGIYTDAPDWLVAGPIVVGAGWPALDLGRREKRARAEGLLPDWEYVPGRWPYVPAPITLNVVRIVVGLCLLIGLAVKLGDLPWRAFIVLTALDAWILWYGVRVVRTFTKGDA